MKIRLGLLLDTILRNRFVVAGMALLLLAVLWFIQDRIQRRYHQPGPIDGINYGYCDFHNGIYWPAVAFLNRVSPYSSQYAKMYPVDRPTPSFAPATFLIHAPFGLLSLRSSEIAYFILMLVLIGVLAFISVRFSGIRPTIGWLLIATLIIVMSRSGYGTLFAGYFTFELIVSTLLALEFGGRPVLGGIFFALAACKPTYAIPLAIMMVARGHWRALALGSAFLLAASLLVYAWLLPGKPWDFMVSDIQEAQSQHMADKFEMPEFSWTRVDVVAVVAKWLKQNPSEFIQLLIMLAMIPIPYWYVRRLTKVHDSISIGGVGGTVVLLAITVLLYRHYYDMLVLVAPLISASYGHRDLWQGVSKNKRIALACLLLVALFNYLSTNLFIDAVHLEPGGVVHGLVTSISGVALAIALVIALFMANDRLEYVQSTGLEPR